MGGQLPLGENSGLGQARLLIQCETPNAQAPRGIEDDYRGEILKFPMETCH